MNNSNVSSIAMQLIGSLTNHVNALNLNHLILRMYFHPITFSRYTLKEMIVKCVDDIHDSVNEGCEDYLSSFSHLTFVTPQSYLSFFSSFKLLYESQLRISKVMQHV